MSVYHLQMRRSGGCTTHAQHVHNLCTGNADTQKAAKVNASGDLTRSASLLNFTRPAVIGAYGQKEQ